MISINLQPEYIVTVLNFPITNTFLTSVLVSTLLIIVGFFFYLQRDKSQNILVAGIKALVLELLKLTDSVTKDRRLSEKILPLIATFFLFIASANLLALFPGFLNSIYLHTEAGKVSLLRSPDSTLTTTLALAIVSVISIQFFSFRALGLKKYLGRFFNLTSPIKFILGLFEMLSEAVKVLSFSFRLFGNVFAGEVLLLVIGFLIPYLVPIPFMLLEVFVGVVQAFIFAVLTLTFIKTSTMRHLSSD